MTNHDKNHDKGAKSSAEEPINPNEYFVTRTMEIAARQQNNEEVYPHKFPVTISVDAFAQKYDYLECGDHLESVTHYMAGRVVRMAASGPKLRFYDLKSNNTRIQVMANFTFHDEKIETFDSIHSKIRRGDIIGIRGFPGKSRRGELSIFPREVQILSPCLRMLPDKDGLKNSELRFRKRYVDLICNASSFDTFITRSKIIRYIRTFLENMQFVEVETPMLNMIAGGASARPFKSFHNDLNMELYMRVAPELYLKKLIVGGIERVFEIGKNFRNEGIDQTHNPEFTAMEFYMAYADYFELMRIAEDLLSGLVLALRNSYIINIHPEGPDQPAVKLDFSPPFPRVSLLEEIEMAANCSIPRPLTSNATREFLTDLLKKHNIEYPKPPTTPKMIDALCGHFVEKKYLNRPFFIMDHPQIMSPLAKYHRSKPEVTERFELFVNGFELINAYTELNDPAFQRKCFEAQEMQQKGGDVEACSYDEDFCVSLEYGLPPTGGFGLGIDRLAMLLTDNITIKEVILFPAMKPIKNDPDPTATTTTSAIATKTATTVTTTIKSAITTATATVTTPVTTPATATVTTPTTATVTTPATASVTTPAPNS